MADLLSPRLASEDEGEVLAQKKTQEMLDAVAKFDAKGVGVDKDACVARKATRGFTVSVGAASPHSPLRSDKRAQTMPAASVRRGDFQLDESVLKKLAEEQAVMKARIRRGSATFSTSVEEDVMKKTWADHTSLMVHGMMTEGQAHGDERLWHFEVGSADKAYMDKDGKYTGKLANPLPGGVYLHCQKGSKGFKDTTPNQDNFSLTTFKHGASDGWTLACAFDGHGPCGHIVSTRAVRTVSYFMTQFSRELSFDDEKVAMDCLIQSFENSQADLATNSVIENWDVQASGSTAVAALWKGLVVYTANAGDSRCTIGSSDKELIFETKDHKPDTPTEKARIESMGGEVRTQTYPDGWVNHRIFVKDESYPGLCMARTLGDMSVKEHGVVATPECAKTVVPEGKKTPFFVLASDGIWEFLDSAFVIKAVAKKIESDGPEKTIEKLQREAKKRWKQEEGDYCDDITSILVMLSP